MKITQWIVFRGVGHGQVESDRGVITAACGKTAWPGLIRYQPKPPPRICPECAAVLGLAGPPAARPEPESAPQQGSLF